MGRQDIPDELIRDVFPIRPWKLATFEDLFEIAVSLDQFRTLDLKISLRELRLKKPVAEFHINFGPLCRVAQQRNAWHESKVGKAPGFDAYTSAKLYSPCHTGVAEDVHKQGVRTQGRIELAPKTVPRG